jgi:hypothetical protein
MATAIRGHLAVAQALLKAGAEIDIKNDVRVVWEGFCQYYDINYWSTQLCGIKLFLLI